jgi:flagellum-specific ATP synthase
MKALAEQIGDIDGVEIFGRVVAVRGLMVEVAGPILAMSVGARLTIETDGTGIVLQESLHFTSALADETDHRDVRRRRPRTLCGCCVHVR